MTQRSTANRERSLAAALGASKKRKRAERDEPSELTLVFNPKRFKPNQDNWNMKWYGNIRQGLAGVYSQHETFSTRHFTWANHVHHTTSSQSWAYSQHQHRWVAGNFRREPKILKFEINVDSQLLSADTTKFSRQASTFVKFSRQAYPFSTVKMTFWDNVHC